MNIAYQQCSIDQNKINTPIIDNNYLGSRASQKTREIVIRGDIPRRHDVIICSGGTCILSVESRFRYNSKRDFNDGLLKNLKNTKDIIFSILNIDTGESRQLEIPIFLSEKLGEYLRNMQAIESDEQYRLPGGLPDHPVNCQSFVYFIKGWFSNKPKLIFKYLRTEEDGKNILPGDVLYIHEGDAGSGEFWHYMVYLGNGYCISKSGEKNIVITRHFIEGLYLVTEK